MAYTSDKRLYTDAARSRVVDEGDPDATYLLVAEGGQLPDADAAKYGLSGDAPAAEGVLYSSVPGAGPDDAPKPKGKAKAAAADESADPNLLVSPFPGAADSGPAPATDAPAAVDAGKEAN